MRLLRLPIAILLLFGARPVSAQTIVCPADTPATVKLAAKEIRRYVWLRTGKLLPVVSAVSDQSTHTIRFAVDPALTVQQFRLKTDSGSLMITGGSDVAVLYGAYAFAEKMGVRFQLDGDVIPDEQIPFALPPLDETRQPEFDLRGIQPFHDFLEGPDWWNADDYKAYAAQLVKMKMNFIGLHSYPWHKPWKHVPPEPGVWIGLPEHVDGQGRVNFSYPASWANTARPGPLSDNAWGHKPGKTSNFSAGAALLFERDDFGGEVMNGLAPWPRTPEQGNTLFNRVGDLFADSFGFARRLGVNVCVGTETPFWVPDEVRAKLQQQGRNPDDPAVLRELCRGMFARIQRSHPVDYFWLWTPERDLDPAKTEADLRMICEVAEAQNPPVKVAVSGWGWLAHQFTHFDKSLPKEIAFSCINDGLGFTPVTPEFGKLQGRARWCIPWMEDDTDLTAPQLFAGRVRQDAAVAKRLGCTGLMGIHWRTKVIAPNLAMLAHSGWFVDESAATLRDVIGSEGTVAPRIHKLRSQPAEDFYEDWCQAQFGASVGPAAAKIFARIDGRLPRPACWALDGKYGSSAGPGIVGDADKRPWETVAKEYAFVDEFAALRPQVTGPGARSRFEYWLGQFQYLKAMSRLRCARAEFDQAIYTAEESSSQAKIAAATAAALSARRQLVADWRTMMTHLLETVSTPGELGTVANLELHTRVSGGYLTNFDARLEKLFGKPLPADCAVSSNYAGQPRLIVPTVRSVLLKGEAFRLKIIALDKQPVSSVTVKRRPLGGKGWQEVRAQHIARAVWEAKFPVAADDFEYFITAGDKLIWPATAPRINQTVVLLEAKP